MTTIYKLRNVINEKIYIGKTKFSVEKRFKEHCKDSKKEKLKHRPLYSDIRKFGISNFEIEPIETVQDDIADEREKYWISYYKTLQCGYNIALGGKGKKLIDADLEALIVQTYAELKNIRNTAKELGIDKDTISKICKTKNIDILPRQKVIQNERGKSVKMIDKDGTLIKVFKSANEAARYVYAERLGYNDSKIEMCHIAECANGKRKTAYGYSWKWEES